MAFNWLRKTVDDIEYDFSYRLNREDEPVVDEIQIEGLNVEPDEKIVFLLDDYLVETWLKGEL